MNEGWKRRLLLIAAAWNLVGGAMPLFDPGHHFDQMYRGALTLDDPVQAFFFRLTWINVLAWGLGYLIAARSPGARGPILLAGAAGKAAWFAACVALFRAGTGTPVLLATGSADLIFAGMFLFILRNEPARPADAEEL
jgi:hypothetical protein